MAAKPNGELVPVGGGDSIPLIRENMKIGRRESCDICLRFPNISGLHCELNFVNGYWELVDLGSTNGVKVNGHKTKRKLLNIDDEIKIANRKFKIKYTPPANGERILVDSEAEDSGMGQSLLEKAGLVRRRPSAPAPTQRKPVNPFTLGEGSDDDDDDDD